MTHTVVKVCGLTTLADARIARAAGADWLGFIVAAGGPREIGAEAMARIVRELDGATTVAVMARVSPAEALALARASGATRIQVHQVDPAGWPADFPLPTALVTGVDAGGMLRGALAPPPHLVHLDTARGDTTGGSGRTFPWSLAREAVANREFMLAGGLDADNVADAMHALHPFGVDASSRLESAPGVKDAARVQAFVAAVRALDARRVA